MTCILLSIKEKLEYTLSFPISVFYTTIKIIKRNVIVKSSAMELVPHSTNIYNECNIKACINNYSTFFTGSD